MIELLLPHSFCGALIFNPFWDFPDFFRDFLDLSGVVPMVLFLFLGLLAVPMRKSPERVRDTIRTFPEKSGKPPAWNPRFTFSHVVSGKEKAHKHEQSLPVTARVGGGFSRPGGQGSTFMCCVRKPRNINIFVWVPGWEDR